MGALLGLDLRQVLGPWREVRCRVCGGADCSGALHFFLLCNSQRPGPPEALEPFTLPADEARELPGQLPLPLRW